MYPPWQSSGKSPQTFVSNFTDYTKNIALESLLENKTVAYVCPSPHLEGKGLGAYIDSHDIVVRAGSLKHSSQHVDYGSRTDMVVHSFNSFEIPVAEKNLDFLRNTKFVICAMVSADFVNEHNRFFNFLRRAGVWVEKPEDSYLYKVFLQVGTICNVGLSGLVVLLNYNIKSVFVTGMSFYNMGKYGRVYEDDYYKMVTREAKIYQSNSDGETSPGQARADLHNQQAQIDYFRELIKLDERISVDDYLKENL